MWNPLEKLKKKIAGAPSSQAAAETAEAAAAAVKDGGTPDLKELEKQGLLGKFFRYWKNPAFLKQMRALAAAMQADGVNIKDQAAVKAWVDKHQKDIMSGKFQGGEAAPEPAGTFTRTEPVVGRNDPCPCGSGKKHKKCCGAA